MQTGEFLAARWFWSGDGRVRVGSAVASSERSLAPHKASDACFIATANFGYANDSVRLVRLVGTLVVCLVALCRLSVLDCVPCVRISWTLAIVLGFHERRNRSRK